jgi:O-antigen/teichoic acid export membrane protein
MLSLESLGLFAVAAKISLIMIFPVGAFQIAFLPLVMRIYKDEGAIDLFNLVLTLYTTALAALVLLLTIFAKPLVVFLAGDSYITSANLVFPLAAAIFFNSLGLFLGIGSIISQKTYLRLLAHIVSQVCCYALMVLLAGAFNTLGIAVAIMLGKALLGLLNAALGQYLQPMRWKYRIVWAMSTVILLFGYYISTLGINYFASGITLALTLITVLIVGWGNLSNDEKEILRSLI